MTIDELLTRGVGEIIERQSLLEKLNSGKKLRVKYGIDPNKKDIHLGHAVPIKKLKAFQDLGHTAVFIIGDYTARIGDPSAKEKTRETISKEVVNENAEFFFGQAFKILDKEKTEIHRQSEWFEDFNLEKIIEIASKVSVAQILEHETFKKRIDANQPLMFHEIIYPLLQGYDSVMVRADVELGGTDQKFNLLMGRQLQKAHGQAPQDIFMMKYLLGTDGKEKMSKSLGNYIAISDSPKDMFGKVMSIPDSLITHYYELCTDITEKGLDLIKEELKNGEKNPRDIKAALAKLIVEQFYSASEVEDAEAEFNKVFSHREKPTDIQTMKIESGEMKIDDLLVECDLVSSKSEARRLIEQGAVVANDEKISDSQQIIQIKDGMVIKVGKRKFVKIEK